MAQGTNAAGGGTRRNVELATRVVVYRLWREGGSEVERGSFGYSSLAIPPPRSLSQCRSSPRNPRKVASHSTDTPRDCDVTSVGNIWVPNGVVEVVEVDDYDLSLRLGGGWNSESHTSDATQLRDFEWL